MHKARTLFIVTGMPAVGKTTFARQLAAKTSACLIDIDTATETVVQAAMKRISSDPNDRDSHVFKETFRDPIYQTLFDLADANLPHTDAIITGPFTKELHNPNWIEQIQEKLATPCRVKSIFLHCSPELRKERLRIRDNPRDRSKLRDWEKHQQYYDQESRPAYPHFAVDTGEKEALGKAIKNGLLD